MQVDDRSATFAVDHLHRLFEQSAAFAPRGAEDVSNQAMRVHADQRRLFGACSRRRP